MRGSIEKDAETPDAPALNAAAPRSICTDCGVSRMADPKQCARACQFIAPTYPALERQAHGRARDPARRPDEAFFGPHLAMWRAALKQPLPGAQWTGATTRLCERLFEADAVDAVVAVASDPHDRWRPRPVLLRRAEDMATCRGMRMGYAPVLALVEQAVAAGVRRLAVVGVPCQVYALRALEASLGFERLFVIGTPCSDNTTTENFHTFLSLLTERPEAVSYLEFRADFHVEMRFDDGTRREIPFLSLPLADLPPDFFPTACRSCVDYTNALSDLTIGYMGGRMRGKGEQWVIVRNARGQALLDLLGDEITLRPTQSAGDRRGPVQGFLANLERAEGGLPLRRLPRWLRPVMGWLMPRLGPRGLEFARARVEMKAIESILHLRRVAPARVKRMIPAHIWALARPYGVFPQPGERATVVQRSSSD